MSTSFLNNATSMIEASCGIILHGFICMFKACSDRSVPYIIDIPSAEACGHRSPLYNAKEKSMCVYSMETSATLSGIPI